MDRSREEELLARIASGITGILAIEKMDKEHFYVRIMVANGVGGMAQESKIAHTSAELHDMADRLVSAIYQVSAEEESKKKPKKGEATN